MGQLCRAQPCPATRVTGGCPARRAAPCRQTRTRRRQADHPRRYIRLRRITAGAGSVVLLWGAAGDPIVEWRHLKQPAAEVGPHVARPRPRRRPHRHLARDRPRIDRCRIRLARSDRPGRGRSTTRQPVAILGAISQLCRDHPPQTATPTQSRNLAIPHRRRSAQSRCQSRQSRDLSNLALPLLRGRSCPRTKSTHSSAWTAAGGSTPSATKSTARPRHDHRTDLAATPLLRPSGGTVLADSTRATRAAPPGETVVYPGTVTTNS
jgi:hypothetical protein